jgi:hygromycin-B 7''-O-kinase
MDAALWTPFVQEVCREGNWTCDQVIPGVAGTFPTFIVNRQRVVKFFGPLFEGASSWQAERECGELLKGMPNIPTAALITSGALPGETGWFYLIFEYIPGASIGQLYHDLSYEDKLAMANWLGRSLRKLHGLRVNEDSTLPRLNVGKMRSWTSERLQQEMKGWPTQLASGVDDYLVSHADSIQGSPVCLIHADLTRDHILGKIINGKWETSAIIDFGDAMLGNIYYELAALHLDLFGCDRVFLKSFIDAYGLVIDKDFVPKAMTTSLMHQFDVIGPLFKQDPTLCYLPTLEELADRLWNIDDPYVGESH